MRRRPAKRREAQPQKYAGDFSKVGSGVLGVVCHVRYSLPDHGVPTADDAVTDKNLDARRLGHDGFMLYAPRTDAQFVR